MYTDPPPPKTPLPAWPPAPRLRPPEAAPAARRTLTPLAWLDAVIGLPGGIVLAWIYVMGANILLPTGSQMAVLGDLVVAALFCAAACRAVGRRFPVVAVAAAAGALPVISLFVWIYWPRGR